jgi:hypothetical protein
MRFKAREKAANEQLKCDLDLLEKVCNDEVVVATIARIRKNCNINVKDPWSIEGIREAVEDIKNRSGDPEAASSREYDLYVSFIEFIANDVLTIQQVQLMAKEVLKASDVSFQRM